VNGSRLDELEKRIATLEAHMKVAVIVGAIIGVTGSGLTSILWSGFVSANRQVEALQKGTGELDARVAALRRDVDSNLTAAVERGKAQILAFASRQIDQAARDAVTRLSHTAASIEWQPLQLENGWANHTPGYADASVHKDAFGVVHLRGLVSSGTGVVATLPERYRPDAAVMTAVACAENQPCRAVVNVNGLLWFSPGAAWVSINEIQFRAK
jgi:hypothetical protein